MAPAHFRRLHVSLLDLPGIPGPGRVRALGRGAAIYFSLPDISNRHRVTMKRGRPTRIDAKLTRQFCELFREGISVTATCAALEVSESKFHEWMKKGEQGEKPYAEFRQRTLCARAWGKIAHLRAIFENKDWRGRAWYLERTFPLEFGRCAERDLPADLEKKKISVAVILNTNGKTLEEVTNFPIVDDLSPPKNEAKPTDEPGQVAASAKSGSRPIVGAGGRVIGWTDEEDDADAR